jgi:serine/threonine protein phosphatase PrpC
MGDTLRQVRDGRPTPTLRYVSAGATNVGGVRKLNEDAFLDRGEIGLWVVADGLGGESAGDVASTMIVDTLTRIASPSNAASFLTDVRDQLKSVNATLRIEAAKLGPDRVIASTVVALLIHGEHFACAWAGDSRLYLLRNGTLHRVSVDHSEVQDLVDRGLLDASRASNHPNANVLTRAVGAAEELQLDLRQDQIYDGDVFVLCSDGLTKMLSDREIEQLAANRAPVEAVGAMMETALTRVAIDNVTVVVVKVVGNGNG